MTLQNARWIRVILGHWIDNNPEIGWQGYDPQLPKEKCGLIIVWWMEGKKYSQSRPGSREKWWKWEFVVRASIPSAVSTALRSQCPCSVFEGLNVFAVRGGGVAAACASDLPRQCAAWLWCFPLKRIRLNKMDKQKLMTTTEREKKIGGRSLERASCNWVLSLKDSWVHLAQELIKDLSGVAQLAPSPSAKHRSDTRNKVSQRIHVTVYIFPKHWLDCMGESNSFVSLHSILGRPIWSKKLNKNQSMF
jgi:hypothetical protein